MEIVHKLLFLLLTVFISVLNLTTFSDSRATNLGNHNPTSINTHESHAKGEGQTRIPFVDYTSLGKPVEYPYDPSGSLASVYIPASETGFQGPGIGKDGLEGAFLFNGYPQGGSYGYGYGYGYPNQGGVYGSPQGIFRFPQGIFRFPRGIFGLPRNIFGSAGGYGGFPGGYGGNPGGYGGYPGGYGGNPGGYGGGQLGHKPGGGGYPGYGGKAEVKGTEANPHN